MKKLLILLLFSYYTNSFAATLIPAGNVSGTWTLAGSPYYIQGSIQIPDGQTLSIDPGVSVEFQGHYKLNVQGRLLAIGTVTDTIIVTANDTANGWGGIRFDNTPATNDTSKIKYCKLQYGKATDISPNNNGGGLYFNNFSKTIIFNCTISNCKAYNRGGGIYFNASNTVVSKNTISNNTASAGGGIYSGLGSSSSITDNTIFSNTALVSGGGICCESSNPTIANNKILSNSSGFSSYAMGGGIFCSNSSNSAITGNIISGNNEISGDGGGIGCYQSSPTISNNTIFNNTTSQGYGGGICCAYDSSPTITHNTISGNTASASGAGGGISCTNSNAIISNNTIAGNTTNNKGGGISCYGCSPTINNNVISNNNAVSNGGGGIYCDVSSSTISGNIISNNIAINGGGIYCNDSSLTFINNTITNNKAAYGGALFCNNNSNSTLLNTVLWGNIASIGGAQVYLNNDSSDPSFYYCDVQGGSAAFELNDGSYTGDYQNNSDADPKFVSPSAGSGAGFNGVTADWSLQSSSPCIDKGDPSGTYPATDKAGNPRVSVCRIDMGAYEYQSGSPLTATITQTQQILCHGDAVAALTANPVGGASSDTYSYSWSNGSTLQSLTGLTAGTYSVVVNTSVSQCQVAISYTVSQPTQIILNQSHKDDNACNVINDGWAKVNVTGGVMPYVYLWSNSNSTNSISGLAPGNYSVATTDNNGCIASSTITIGSFSITITPHITSVPDTCTGDVGKITASPTGGLGIYTYAWSNGSSTQNISGLHGGNYSVTISDSLGCSISNSPTVGVYTNTITTTFTSTLANCHKANGSLTANPTGGTNPYNYIWSNGNSAQSVNNLVAGNYTVNVTDKNGCRAHNSSAVGTSTVLPTPEICMVTVDSLSQYNVIVWDKTPFVGIAAKSFIIYRDTANNSFAPVGKVAFNSLSLFIDSARTLYAANGDPNFSSWRYKIALSDSCGNVSSKSSYHQSLFIQNNGANFNWTDYKIEGQPVPIPSLSNYLFQRDDFSTGHYATIATLSASSNLSTDPQYSTFQNTANWRVQTQWSLSCTPSHKNSEQMGIRAIKSTQSNTTKRGMAGVNENELERSITIYPNPNNGKFTLEISNTRGSLHLAIYNMLGKLMYAEIFNEKKKDINCMLPKGLYQLQIETNLGKANKKIVVE